MLQLACLKHRIIEKENLFQNCKVRSNSGTGVRECGSLTLLAVGAELGIMGCSLATKSRDKVKCGGGKELEQRPTDGSGIVVVVEYQADCSAVWPIRGQV
jgi:hypothetical protein